MWHPVSHGVARLSDLGIAAVVVRASRGEDGSVGVLHPRAHAVGVERGRVSTQAFVAPLRGPLDVHNFPAAFQDGVLGPGVLGGGAWVTTSSSAHSHPAAIAVHGDHAPLVLPHGGQRCDHASRAHLRDGLVDSRRWDPAKHLDWLVPRPHRRRRVNGMGRVVIASPLGALGRHTERAARVLPSGKRAPGDLVWRRDTPSGGLGPVPRALWGDGGGERCRVRLDPREDRTRQDAACFHISISSRSPGGL